MKQKTESAGQGFGFKPGAVKPGDQFVVGGHTVTVDAKGREVVKILPRRVITVAKDKP